MKTLNLGEANAIDKCARGACNASIKGRRWLNRATGWEYCTWCAEEINKYVDDNREPFFVEITPELVQLALVAERRRR